MPRGKKKLADEPTFNVPDNAKELAGTNNGVMKVYTSKPKKTAASPAKKPSTTEYVKTAEKVEIVSYEINDTEHPIEDIKTFVHANIYWVPNSEKFIVENNARTEGKSILSVPCTVLTGETVDLDEVNAIFGMHFNEVTKNQFEFIRAGIIQDTENIRVFRLCEMGLTRDKDKLQYTYIMY